MIMSKKPKSYVLNMTSKNVLYGLQYSLNNILNTTKKLTMLDKNYYGGGEW